MSTSFAPKGLHELALFPHIVQTYKRMSGLSPGFLLKSGRWLKCLQDEPNLN